MKYPVYSIRDKATAFMAPMVDVNEQSAIRNFAQAVNSGNGSIGFQPGDFDLYKIGEFDDKKGIVTPVEPIEFVVNGNNLFKVGVKDEM